MTKDDKVAVKGSGKAGSKGETDAGAGKGLGGYVAEAKDFFEQAQGELHKIAWPSRKETTSTSIVVLVVVLVMVVYLGVVDSLLAKIIAAVLS